MIELGKVRKDVMVLLIFLKLFLKIQYLLLLVGGIVNFIKAISAATKAKRKQEVKKAEDIIGEMELDNDGDTPVYRMSKS